MDQLHESYHKNISKHNDMSATTSHNKNQDMTQSFFITE